MIYQYISKINVFVTNVTGLNVYEICDNKNVYITTEMYAYTKQTVRHCFTRHFGERSRNHFLLVHESVASYSFLLIFFGRTSFKIPSVFSITCLPGLYNNISHLVQRQYSRPCTKSVTTSVGTADTSLFRL